MFSGNGFNFVDSKNKLREMYDMFRSQQLKGKLADFCYKSAIDEGLWEAGVCFAKYPLKLITGTANMSFEEYTTVLTRI